MSAEDKEQGSPISDQPTNALDSASPAAAPLEQREPTSIQSALGSMFDDLQDRYNEPEHLNYTTGFEELDALTAGFHDEDLIVVGGRPSAGKTSFVLALCQHMALRRMRAVAFFNLESSATRLATKIVSSLSGVDTTSPRF